MLKLLRTWDCARLRMRGRLPRSARSAAGATCWSTEPELRKTKTIWNNEIACENMWHSDNNAYGRSMLVHLDQSQSVESFCWHPSISFRSNWFAAVNIVFRLPDFGCLPCLHHVHFCMGDFAIDKVHGVHGGLNASILKKNRVPSLLYESSLIHIMVYTMCLSMLNQSISSLQRVYSFSSITFQMSVGSLSFWRTLARGWWFPWFPLRRWSLTWKAGRASTWTMKLRDSSKLKAAHVAKADLFCHLWSLRAHLPTVPYNSVCLLTSLHILACTYMYLHPCLHMFFTSPYISFQLVTAFYISLVLRASPQVSLDQIRFPCIYSTCTSTSHSCQV